MYLIAVLGISFWVSIATIVYTVSVSERHRYYSLAYLLMLSRPDTHRKMSQSGAIPCRIYKLHCVIIYKGLVKRLN